MVNYVDTVAANSIEFRASRQGISVADWMSNNPEKLAEITGGIREQMRRSNKRFRDMERDSV